MGDGTGVESRRAVRGLEGSIPSPSAIKMEGVRLVEETVSKTAGLQGLGGSIPLPSASR